MTDFKNYWEARPSIDYDEMVEAKAAFDFQQAEIAQQAERIKQLEAENDALKKSLREIYEVWAGSEGTVSTTASEAYQEQLIKEMRDIAAQQLRSRDSE